MRTEGCAELIVQGCFQLPHGPGRVAVLWDTTGDNMSRPRTTLTTDTDTVSVAISRDGTLRTRYAHLDHPTHTHRQTGAKVSGSRVQRSHTWARTSGSRAHSRPSPSASPADTAANAINTTAYTRW